jgi:hypothetical protein
MQFSNYSCDFLDPDQMNITIQSSVDRRSGHDSTAADRTDPPGQAHSTHPPARHYPQDRNTSPSTSSSSSSWGMKGLKPLSSAYFYSRDLPGRVLQLRFERCDWLGRVSARAPHRGPPAERFHTRQSGKRCVGVARFRDGIYFFPLRSLRLDGGGGCVSVMQAAAAKLKFLFQHPPSLPIRSLYRGETQAKRTAKPAQRFGCEF